MKNEEPGPYIQGRKPQKYKPVDDSIANIILEYRDDIISVQLKIIEIMQIFEHYKHVSAKIPAIEAFAKVNHCWDTQNIPQAHRPIMHKDSRGNGTELKTGIDCLTCNHNYDPWQAVCPRCAKLAHEKYKATEAENKNLKSFFKLIMEE